MLEFYDGLVRRRAVYLEAFLTAFAAFFCFAFFNGAFLTCFFEFCVLAMMENWG